MRKADFQSVRGPFTYNVNHHPIQDFYLLKAVQGPKEMQMHIEKKVFDDHKDAYFRQCRMKW
jgi:branched-chain amino acid transport system substrate-binding protein